MSTPKEDKLAKLKFEDITMGMNVSQTKVRISLEGEEGCPGIQVDKAWLLRLRLAYSMTIHKSQGLTLSEALIDIRAAREPGQAYVALSRLKSLKGLHIKDWFSGVFVSPDAIEFYRQIERNNAVAA